jgi:pimeloyl-ACP methyl ester carboxylesterase
MTGKSHPAADGVASDAQARPPRTAAARARRAGPRCAGWLWAVALGLALGAAPAVSAPAAGAGSTVEIAPLPTGQVVRRSLSADPGQEYLVYVPSTGGERAPLFVTVHGISRNFEEHATLFSTWAERYGVVLAAPVFSRERHSDYQRLGRAGRGPRADLALDAIVDEIEAATGAAAEPFYLFGFSGGAQFAHRYTMAHPERVAAAALGAAGWYTFPDEGTPYPYGIGPDADLPNVRFEPDKFLRVPIAVFVGGADVGSENVRRNAAVDRQQGTTRLERARNWVAAMRAAALQRGLEPRISVQDVPGIRHSFRQFMEEGELGERVFRALFGPPPAGRPRPADVSSERRSERRRGPADEVEVGEPMPQVAACAGWR